MLECIVGENKEIKRHYRGRGEMRIKRVEEEKGGREREVEKREGEESYKMRNGAWYLRE